MNTKKYQSSFPLILKLLTLAFCYSTSNKAMEQSPKDSSGFIHPAPFQFYIQQTYNLHDQQDFFLYSHLIQNPTISPKARESLVNRLKELDLKGFHPAQEFLADIYFNGLFKIQKNEEAARYYNRRAYEAHYPPVLYNFAVNILMDAAQPRWAPVYNEDGEIIDYVPCIFEPAAELLNQFYYPQRAVAQTASQQEISLQEGQEPKAIALKMAREAKTLQASLKAEPEKTSYADAAAKGQRSQRGKNEKESEAKPQHLRLKKENPTNYWMDIGSKLAVNETRETILKEIPERFNIEFQRAEIKTIRCMAQGDLFSTLLAMADSLPQAAFTVGAILYTCASKLSEKTATLLKKTPVASYLHTKQAMREKAYEALLKAQELQNPEVFFMLAELGNAEDKAMHLRDAYSCASDQETKNKAISRLEELAKKNDLNAHGLLLAIKSADKETEKNEEIIKHLQFLVRNIKKIDDRFLLFYNLFKSLAAWVNRAQQQQAFYLVGSLFINLNYTDLKLGIRHKALAKEYLHKGLYFCKDALYQCLKISFESDDVEHAIKLFDETAQETSRWASPLRKVIGLCKKLGQNNPAIACFIARACLEGMPNIVEKDNECAFQFLEMACAQGELAPLRYCLAQAGKLASAYRPQNYDDLEQFLSVIQNGLAAYLKKHGVFSVEIEKDLTALISLWLPDEASIPFLYSLVSIIFPYNQPYALSLLDHVENFVIRNFTKNEDRDGAIQAIDRCEVLPLLLENQKNPQVALRLFTSLYCRFKFGVIMPNQKSPLHTITILLELAQIAQGDEQTDQKTSSVLRTQAFYLAGKYWLDQQNYATSQSYLLQIKDRDKKAQILYSVLLLKINTTFVIDKVLLALEEFESATKNGLEINEIRPIVGYIYFLARFYSDPPYARLKNLQRAEQLAEPCSQAGYHKATKLLEEIRAENTRTEGSTTGTDAQLEKGKRLFRQGHYRQAADIFSSLENHPESKAYLGLMQFDQGEYTKSIENFILFLSNAPGSGGLETFLISEVLSKMIQSVKKEGVLPTVSPGSIKATIEIVLRYFRKTEDKNSFLLMLAAFLESIFEYLINQLQDEQNLRPCLAFQRIVFEKEVLDAIFETVNEEPEISLRLCTGFYAIFTINNNYLCSRKSILEFHKDIERNNALLMKTCSIAYGHGIDFENYGSCEREIYADLFLHGAEYHESEKNYMLAYRYYTKCLEINSSQQRARFCRGCLTLTQLYDEPSIARETGINDLTIASQEQYAEASFLLINFYANTPNPRFHLPKSFKKNHKKALQLLATLATHLLEKTHLSAHELKTLYDVGREYFSGAIGRPNAMRAYQCFAKVKQHGGTFDTLYLGVCAKELARRDENYLPKALENLKETNNSIALLHLSLLYLTHPHLKEEAHKGLEYFQTFLEEIKEVTVELATFIDQEILPLIKNFSDKKYQYLTNYLIALYFYKSCIVTNAPEGAPIFLTEIPPVYGLRYMPEKVEAALNALKANNNLKEHAPKIHSLSKCLTAALHMLGVYFDLKDLPHEMRLKLAFNFILQTIQQIYQQDEQRFLYPEIKNRIWEIIGICKMLGQQRKLAIDLYTSIVAPTVQALGIPLDFQ